MDRTLILVKPDAMERNLGGTILARLEKTGLKDLLTPVLAVLEGTYPEIGVHEPALKALQELRGADPLSHPDHREGQDRNSS